ncbi:MAG: alpha-ketoglutarate-dependent dioxygenase AlkB [Pseudomonadota bacterium]
MTPLSMRGARIYPGLLSPERQSLIVELVREIVRAAPLVRPVTSRGQEMSVRMTSAGRFGWVSDQRGYRYEAQHPVTEQPWPDIPDELTALWAELCPQARSPECCLINFYSSEAKMGAHQDRDEADFTQPVVSISLGDDALFRIGNHERGGKTQSIWLRSGDVVVLEGDARLRFHGVDRIRPGQTSLLKDGGRLNLTMRVVT